MRAKHYRTSEPIRGEFRPVSAPGVVALDLEPGEHVARTPAELEILAHLKALGLAEPIAPVKVTKGAEDGAASR